MEAALLTRRINTIRAEAETADNIAEYNAQVSLQQGQAAQRRRAEEALVIRKRAQTTRSRNIAKGAPLLILQENAANAAIAEFNVQTRGLEEEAQFRSQAGIDLFRGKIAQDAAKKRITGSVIESGKKIASNIAKFGPAGGLL
jgi:hypothetical protein